MGKTARRHVAGDQKQKNKTHKRLNGHRSKGEISRQAGSGRSVISKRTRSSTASSHATSRNRAASSLLRPGGGWFTGMRKKQRGDQLRRTHQTNVKVEKRSVGACHVGSAPHLVCVVSLHYDVSADAIINNMISMLDSDSDCQMDIDDKLMDAALRGKARHFVCRQLKRRFSFVTPHFDDIASVLDAVFAADHVIFLVDSLRLMHSAAVGDLENDRRSTLLSCLRASGCPSATFVSCASDEESHASKKKFLLESKRFVQKFAELHSPSIRRRHDSDTKICQLETESQCRQLLHRIASQRPTAPACRRHRAYMLPDSIEVRPFDQQKTALHMTGFIRGDTPLSANDLIHLTGFGDFQLSTILSCPEPKSLNIRNHSGVVNEDMADYRVLQTSDVGQQESLVAENIVDDMDNADQPWPTAEDEEHARSLRRTAKVDAGTSDYQAAWIVDSDESCDDDDDSSDGSEDVDMMHEDESSSENDDDGDFSKKVSFGDVQTKSTETEMVDDDDEMSGDEEDATKAKEWEMARRRERDDAAFPDEIDTPICAREVLRNFRGLESFKDSPWDVNECLPTEYSRIFRFSSFERSRKLALKAVVEDGALSGWYVTIVVKDAPVDAILEHCQQGKTILAVRLLRHERKTSLINVLLKRTQSEGEDEDPVVIESNCQALFRVGFRWLTSTPVFSTHSSKGGDKFKLERFFRDDQRGQQHVVASLYAPIILTPAMPVMMFTQGGNGGMVASGSVMSVDPDRVVLRRVVLSGHPFKIAGRSAVVRYMFHDRADVEWFKPVRLRTKYGRKGHVTEALGTHGRMKCVFDGILPSMDTVLMQLYERVFPLVFGYQYIQPHMSV